MGAMVQSNSIACCMQTAFGINSWLVGLFLVTACAIIFAGGIKRLAAVVEKIVPVMAALIYNWVSCNIDCKIQYIPETFGMIFKYAFCTAGEF